MDASAEGKLRCCLLRRAYNAIPIDSRLQQEWCGRNRRAATLFPHILVWACECVRFCIRPFPISRHMQGPVISSFSHPFFLLDLLCVSTSSSCALYFFIFQANVPILFILSTPILRTTIRARSFGIQPMCEDVRRSTHAYR